ncbi:MAG: TetR/AcrR family transcriptional regulator [Pseudomonadota bacterium]
MGTQTGRAARFQAKHNDILEAAKAVFLRRGFARASVDELASEAAVSTATLYRHFKSKEALFAAVAGMSLRSMDDILPTPGTDPIESLSVVARGYAALLSSPETRRLMRMLIAETGDGGAMATAFYETVKLQLSDRFVACVNAGVDAGQLRPVPTQQRPEIAGQLQGMIEHATLMRGLVLGDTIDLGARTPDDIANEAVATWLARWSV